MIYYEDDCSSEHEVDEKLHFQAMLFKAQCLWRHYEELAAAPHNERKAWRLLDEIDTLEANLKEMGAFAAI